MSYQPQPFFEHPNLKTPIALIVDDPAPCINPVWYFRRQVDKQESPVFCKTIPLAFMEEWCHWTEAEGIRGDFTVLPYPAGLGRIDESLEGYDTAELQAWMELARKHVAPRFDIHCEILTHTMAMDLSTWKLRDVSEHDWINKQDEETLAVYFAAAMRILKEAGLPNFGLTQPCYFGGDEAMYASALLAAEREVNGRSVSHNFNHVDGTSHYVPPRVTLLDAAAGEAVLSVWAATDDYVWNAQEPKKPESVMPPEIMADRFVTEDGRAGRVPRLLAGGGPIVLVTHWQSLYSNGSKLGLRVFREAVSRITALYADRLEWCKLSELCSRHLAAHTARVHSCADRKRLQVEVSSPFDTDILTLSIPTPWPLFRAPEVSIDGRPAPQAKTVDSLTAGAWLMRGSLVTASFPVKRNQTVSIEVVGTGE